MIQIRGNIFETNSSSSHSLVLVNTEPSYWTADEIKNKLRWHLSECVDAPGKYIYRPRIYDGDASFNRYPFRVLDTFELKLWYLYAHAPTRKYPPKGRRKYTRYQPEYYKITNYLKKYLPWLEGVDWRYCDEKPSSEAIGLGSSLSKLQLDWYKFLFDKNLVVIVDGDEYCTWERMKTCGLVDTKNIRKEVVFGG